MFHSESDFVNAVPVYWCDACSARINVSFLCHRHRHKIRDVKSTLKITKVDSSYVDQEEEKLVRCAPSRSCSFGFLDDRPAGPPHDKDIPVARRGKAVIPNLVSTSWRDNSCRLGAGVGNEWIEATRPAISYRNHHRHQFDTNMDELRGGISRFKQNIKHRLGESNYGEDKPGSGGREESVSSSSSFPQPEPHVSTGGREQEGSGPNAENENVGASAAMDENRPGWGSTASSSARLALQAVRDSANTFGPLKSVAGGLCLILENCGVRCLPSYVASNT